MATNVARRVWIASAVLLTLAGTGARAEKGITRFPELPEIQDKTLVVWCSVADLDQRGGGVLTLERDNHFDAIVFGEVAPRKWMAGSELFARTQVDQAASTPEDAGPNTLVQLSVVYREREVSLFRNGALYARYNVDAVRPFGSMSKVLMGLRHEAIRRGGNGYFAGVIEEARLYNMALNAEQLAALRPGELSEPRPLGMWTFEDGTAKDQMGVFPEGTLRGGAYIAEGRLHLDGKDDFMMTPAGTRFAKNLHFRPDSGVLGDTIPFFWKGDYHVFYLRGRGWSHLVSRDLVDWKELPDAIQASKGETAPDGENCWTGSIIEHEGTFHLFYTGKNMSDPLGDQKVMHATSGDLIAWTKLPELTFYADGHIYWSKPANGPVNDRMNYHHQAFRDPEVFWNEEEGAWWMLLHAALADASKAAFACYVSDDLMTWEAREPVFTYPLSVSGDCPNIFPVDGRWYIIAADRHYTVAQAPGGPYAPEMLPYGCGELFVPKTMFDGQRRILLGWIHDREGHTDAGKGRWGGVLSIARELYADNAGRLCQRPAREVVAAFSERLDGGLATLASGDVLDTPPNYMLHGRITAGSTDTVASIHFRRTNEAPGYQLTIDFSERRISLGDEKTRFERVCDFDASQPVDVRLFVVGTVAECFVNDAYAFTVRCYDHAEGNVVFQVEGGDAAMREVAVFVQEPTP